MYQVTTTPSTPAYQGPQNGTPNFRKRPYTSYMLIYEPKVLIHVQKYWIFYTFTLILLPPNKATLGLDYLSTPARGELS